MPETSNPMHPPYQAGDLTILTGWWSNPCEPGLLVYLESFGQALENAFLTLIVPQWDDIARGFIRPSHRHEKRRGRKKGGIQGVPELGEIMGQEARAASGLIPPTVDEGGKILWKIDGIMQAGGYVAMIHSVADDFYFDLLAGIMSNKDTKCTNVARIEMEGEGFFQTPPVGWTAKPMTALNYVHNMDNHPFSVGVPPGQFVAIYVVEVENNSALPVTGQVQCSVQSGPFANDEIEFSPRKDLGQHQTTKLMATLKFAGPSDVSWNYFSANSETFIKKHTINIFQFGDPLPPHP